MGENLTEFIFDVAMTMLFIVALSLFLVLNPASEKVVDLLESTINRDKDVMESVMPGSEYATVTGADIIGNIINGLETDIEIGGKYIDAENTNPYNFDFASIDKTGVYKIRTHIGSDGIVESIVYELE